MDPKNLLSAFFILILVYLLVKNAQGTNTAVQGLSSGVTSIISTLQGNSNSGIGNIGTIGG